MESKWWAIAVAVWIGSLCAGMAYSEHANGQCKIAAIAQGMPADDIIKLCK